MSTKAFRVLVLDDSLIGRGDRELAIQGVRVAITALKREEIMRDAISGYRISSRGLKLAGDATSYDAVIIGNNMGTGFAYAREIPGEMKPHTMIVWNTRKPDDEAAYARFGFEHFGVRHQDEVGWLIQQAEEAATRTGA